MAAIRITNTISIDERELVETTARASGPGGQHVNTTDSAVILRFDVAACGSLSDGLKDRLLRLAGARATKEGVIVLRGDGSRSQAVNREEVRARLFELIGKAAVIPKKRRPTKPTKGSQQRRLDAKSRRSAIKAARSNYDA